MLSRTAASLYWTGRYVERADFVARLVDAGGLGLVTEEGSFLMAIANVLAIAFSRLHLEEQIRHRALHELWA